MNLPSYSRVINFLQVEYIYMYVDIDSFALHVYAYGGYSMHRLCMYECTTTTLVFFKKIPPAPGAG